MPSLASTDQDKRSAAYGPDVCTSAVFELELMASEDGESRAPETIPIFPNRKTVQARDGRAFTIDDPQALIDSVRAGGVDLVIGRAHDEVGSFFSSSPAPAAGWISHKDGLIRDGKYGIKAKVQWTDIGHEAVKSKSFRYVSPVVEAPGMYEFLYEKGPVPTVTAIVAASLVNIPALRMPSLNSKQHHGVGTMNEETRKRLCAAFGLPLDAHEETIFAAAESRQPEAPQQAAGQESAPEGLAASHALAEVVQKLSAEVAMLRARQEVSNFGALPKELRDLAESGFRAGGEIAELTRQMLSKAAPGFAALSKEDEPGKPATDSTYGLSEEDLAFCDETGIKPEDFAKHHKRLEVVS